jgi:putative transposase
VTPARSTTPAPAVTPCTGVLDWEIEAILALFNEWGETDGSYRKLAHRGSYLHRVWVSPSTVWRVLSTHDKVLPARPRPEPTPKKPWPDWVELRPNSVWGYDVTHFTRAKRAVIAIIDLVSRYWINYLVSAEETSTQVQIVFTRALEAQGLLTEVLARTADGTVPIDVDDDARPILLAVSDNGGADDLRIDP